MASACIKDREEFIRARSSFYSNRLRGLSDKLLICGQRLSGTIERSIANPNTGLLLPNEIESRRLDVARINGHIKRSRELQMNNAQNQEAFYREIANLATFLNGYKINVGVVQEGAGPEDCIEAAKCYLRAWADVPRLCPEEQPKETAEPKKPVVERPEPGPCERPPAEKWGVRFKYGNTNSSLKCLPSTTRTGLIDENGVVTREREWFLSLLPAMRSVIPLQGGMDTPNAMPGLQFRVSSNIAKHRVPGFQPIYQHLGVDSLYITLVGTFTGDGGLGYTTRSAPQSRRSGGLDTGNFREAEGRITKHRVGSIDEITPGERYSYIPSRGGLRADQRDINADFSGSWVEREGSRYVLVSPAGVIAANATITSNTTREPISRETLQRWIREGRVFNAGPTDSDRALDQRRRFREIEEGVNRDAIRANPTDNNLDLVPTARYKESNWLEGKLFTQDGCPGTCPEYNEEGNQWRNVKDAKPLNHSSSYAASKSPLYEIAAQLDSYHEFVSFYKLAVQQGNELEVEVNMRKNNDGLVPRQGIESDPLRDIKTGNPKFKGYVRRMEVYHARSDRTWYLIEIEVTDHAMAGKTAINLTDDLTLAANKALEETINQIEQAQEQATAETNVGVGVYTDTDGTNYTVLPPGTQTTIISCAGPGGSRVRPAGRAQCRDPIYRYTLPNNGGVVESSEGRRYIVAERSLTNSRENSTCVDANGNRVDPIRFGRTEVTCPTGYNLRQSTYRIRINNRDINFNPLSSEQSPSTPSNPTVQRVEVAPAARPTGRYSNRGAE